MIVKAVSSPILQVIHHAVEDRCVRDLPDQELVHRFHAQQDQSAFHALLRRHGAMVLDACRGVLGNDADAEDAFQATFLILARKADSIRKTASVGSWLHGVAKHTALKARAQSATRQKHEARVPLREASEPDDLSWRELRQVLHEELRRLPERYRAPLLLCYLEGATQDAAAAQLNLAKSTLRERLERGRALLRTRLMRRGLGPAALLIAVAWPAAHGSSSVPVSLVVSTVKAATGFAAGSAAASVVSAKVAAITEGVLNAMFLTKLKIASLVLLVVAATLGAGGLLYRTGAAEAVIHRTMSEVKATERKTLDEKSVARNDKEVQTPQTEERRKARARFPIAPELLGRLRIEKDNQFEIAPELLGRLRIEKDNHFAGETRELHELFRKGDVDVFVDGDMQKPFIKGAKFDSIVEISGKKFLQFTRAADAKTERLLVEPARIAGLRVSN